MFLNPDQREARAKFKEHVAQCAQCQGPDDGCETGCALETLCFHTLGFDPYIDEFGHPDPF